MKRYMIWGAGKIGKKILDVMSSDTRYECVGFVDSDTKKWGAYVENIQIVSVYSYVTMCKKEDLIIVIPLAYGDRTVMNMVDILHKYNNVPVEQIYFCPKYLTDNEILMKNNIEKIFTNCVENRELVSLSYIVRTDCNLSCKGCTTCSPLVKDDNSVDIDLFTKDINRLRELFDNIQMFSLQGGEILLDEKRMLQYMECYSSIFPYSKMNIRTNGVRIKSLNRETLTYIREKKVLVVISLYPFMQDKAEELVRFLEKEQIEYQIEYSPEFTMRFSGKKIHEIRKKSEMCRDFIGYGCLQIHRGKLSRCPMPRTMEYLNEYFEERYPCAGEIDLFENHLSVTSIYERLAQPIPACAYCRMGEIQYNIPHTLLAQQGGHQRKDWIDDGN